jgi:hypothetical protein
MDTDVDDAVLRNYVLHINLQRLHVYTPSIYHFTNANLYPPLKGNIIQIFRSLIRNSADLNLELHVHLRTCSILGHSYAAKHPAGIMPRTC